MLRTITVSIGFLICATLFSQQYKGYNFKHLTSEDGLSQSFVSEIVQDSKGFLWFGTMQGINRYDGREIRLYEERGDSMAMSSYMITKLLLDSRNILWVGTVGGIGRYDIGKDKFLSLDYITGDSLETGRVYDIIELANGDIIFSSDKTLYRYIRSKNKVVDIAPTNLQQKYHAAITEVELSPDGNIYFVMFDKLFYYDIEKGLKQQVAQLDNAFTKELDKMDNYVCFTIDKRGNIWLGSAFGKMYQYNHYKKHYSQIPLNNTNVCNAVYVESDSTVLFSFDYLGLVRYNHVSRTFEHIFDAESKAHTVCNNKITSIFIDHQRNLWLGHIHAGVSYTNLLNSGFQGIDFSQYKGEIFPVVSAIHKQSNGNIWVGTDGGGIVKYNSNLQLLEKYAHDESDKNSLSNNAVLTFYEDRKGTMWVGSYRGGLSKYMPNENGFVNYMYDKNDSTTIRHNDVRDIIEDDKGFLWIAVHGRLIHRFNPETGVFEKFKDLYKGPPIGMNFWSFDLEFDNSGGLWIAHTNGAMRFDTASNQFNLFSSDVRRYENISNRIVHSILKDSNGNMWFCTDKGFVRYRIETDSFELIKALPESTIQSAEEDKYGNFWIGTGKGMYKYNDFSKEVRFFIKSDGLHGNEFVKKSSACFKSREMLFGLVNGFDIFHVDSLKFNSEPPQLEILSVEVMQNKLPYSQIASKEKLILNYAENFITFQFAALNYINAEKNKYKYKLEGLEDDWNTAGKERRAVYTSLPSGKYTFLLRASNNDGVWNNQSVAFEFEIKPPFWNTWWFKIVILLFTLALLAVVHKLRMFRIKTQKAILERKVKVRTNELLETNEMLKKVNTDLQNSKDEIVAQAEEIKVVNDKLRNKQGELEDSFHYAQNIQQFIMPPVEVLESHFSESFLFNKPRDIVSGDFFWAKSEGEYAIFAVADCTGHGVPGAMISMLGINLLEELTKKDDYIEQMNTSAILEDLRIQVKHRLNHKSKALFAKEGMDISLCIYNSKTKELAFSGANNPIFIAGKDSVKVVEANKNPIGLYHKEIPFDREILKLSEGDMLYLYSDGFSDQFNGVNGRKLKTKYFRELLISLRNRGAGKQKQELEDFLANWKGNTEQIDDIMVLGVRV